MALAAIVGKPNGDEASIQRMTRYDGSYAPLHHPGQLYEATLGFVVLLVAGRKRRLRQ